MVSTAPAAEPEPSSTRTDPVLESSGSSGDTQFARALTRDFAPITASGSVNTYVSLKDIADVGYAQITISNRGSGPEEVTVSPVTMAGSEAVVLGGDTQTHLLRIGSRERLYVSMTDNNSEWSIKVEPLSDLPRLSPTTTADQGSLFLHEGGGELRISQEDDELLGVWFTKGPYDQEDLMRTFGAFDATLPVPDGVGVLEVLASGDDWRIEPLP